MRADEIRGMFPALDRKVYGRDLVYFDNAATSQRPVSVIDEWNRMTAVSNGNIHRAVHCLAEEATEAVEKARDLVCSFIGARRREEIVFTAGCTSAINLVAFSFGEVFIKEGDEIIVSEAEHHSNIVPWQMMCERKKAVLKVLPVDGDGCIKEEDLDGLLTDKTKLLAVSHISNVLGIVNPVKEIVNKCHEYGVKVLVDGAQGIIHEKVDVLDMDCDFYAFSGHKIFAATGTGILYGKYELLEQMPPYMGGGEMVGTVRFSGTTYAPLPLKFEAGTQNFAGIATLSPALEFAKSVRDDAELKKEEKQVKLYLYNKLRENKRICLYGVPANLDNKISLFSFNVDGVHHEDLALILDKMGIAVRSGQMCAEPLMDRFGVTGMVRISLAVYNTMKEAEYFVECLDKAIDMLK